MCKHSLLIDTLRPLMNTNLLICNSPYNSLHTSSIKILSFWNITVVSDMCKPLSLTYNYQMSYSLYTCMTFITLQILKHFISPLTCYRSNTYQVLGKTSSYNALCASGMNKFRCIARWWQKPAECSPGNTFGRRVTHCNAVTHRY